MDSPNPVIHGTLTPEGTLELDSKPELAPGRVQVIVKPLPSLPIDDPFWQRMQAMWNAQNCLTRVPRSAEEIEAETQSVRDEWEQRSKQLEGQQ